MQLHSSKNPIQLQRLLTIEDPQKETVYGVIGRMEVLLDYLESTPAYKNLIPFLKIYYLVTKKAADKYILYKHYFKSPKDYEMLDVYFATLYFEPLLDYFEKRDMDKPWKNYFLYCQKDDGIPLLQILLGINAHINADLYKALVDLNYKHKDDFILVNSILGEVYPEAIVLLAEKHDLVGTFGLAFRDFIRDEFKTIVIRWRNEVWNSYSQPKSDEKEFFSSLVDNTEFASKKIIECFTNIYHFQHLPDNIREINALSVSVGRL